MAEAVPRPWGDAPHRPYDLWGGNFQSGVISSFDFTAPLIPLRGYVPRAVLPRDVGIRVHWGGKSQPQTQVLRQMTLKGKGKGLKGSLASDIKPEMPKTLPSAAILSNGLSGNPYAIKRACCFL